MGKSDKKRLKMVIYMPHSVKKKSLKVEKSFTDRSAWSKNFSRSEKINSHGNFTLSLLGQSVVWTTPVKKSLRKPMLFFES